MRAISYRRVSTQEQADSGAGMAAQEHTIDQALKARDWARVGDWIDEGVSGGIDWQDRPGLRGAIGALEDGHADILVVAKLDRLSRSMADFANLVARAKKKGWALLILDVGLDLSTPTGELMANILAAFAAFERALISQRTKEALARKKAQGVKIGRPSTVGEAVVQDIIEMRSRGCTYQFIADLLNRNGQPTPQGGSRWRDTSVRAIYKSQRYTLDGLSAAFKATYHGAPVTEGHIAAAEKRLNEYPSEPNDLPRAGAITADRINAGPFGTR
jgi:DNA invertase Pin-like site-specific DNA recombinase